MSSPLSSATPVQPLPPPPTEHKHLAEERVPPTRKDAVPADSVKLSGAALAALQEATETSTQTEREARTGDVQAKHLLAKRAAEKTSQAKAIHVVA
jgi:hypothetical protein